MYPTADEIVAAIRAAFEVAHQGGHDWGGDQRAFHLPRAKAVMLFLMKMYPRFAAEAMAMATARDGYGDLIAGEPEGGG